MTYLPRAYDELDSTQRMHHDCAEAESRMHLPRPSRPRPAELITRPAPSILFEDFPREIRKRDIRVSDAAARLAAAMELHLD